MIIMMDKRWLCYFGDHHHVSNYINHTYYIIPTILYILQQGLLIDYSSIH